MTFLQATAEMPSLTTVIDGFAAIAALYLIRLILSLDKKVTSLMVAWFGDPNSSVPNGAYRKLNTVAQRLEEHANAFETHREADREEREAGQRLATARNSAIQVNLTQIDNRLGAVEEHLTERRKKTR